MELIAAIKRLEPWVIAIALGTLDLSKPSEPGNSCLFRRLASLSKLTTSSSRWRQAFDVSNGSFVNTRPWLVFDAHGHHEKSFRAS